MCACRIVYWLLGLVAVSLASGEEGRSTSLSLIPRRKRIFLTEGSTLRLRCVADEAAAPPLSWYRDRTRIGSGAKYVRKRVDLSDGGVYECRAAGRAVSIRVTVTSPFRNWKSREVVQIDSNATIPCDLARARNAGSITWYRLNGKKNKQKISSFYRIFMNPEVEGKLPRVYAIDRGVSAMVLNVRDVRDADAGLYQCSFEEVTSNRIATATVRLRVERENRVDEKEI